jgi:hypothetical protein
VPAVLLVVGVSVQHALISLSNNSGSLPLQWRDDGHSVIRDQCIGWGFEDTNTQERENRDSSLLEKEWTTLI